MNKLRKLLLCASSPTTIRPLLAFRVAAATEHRAVLRQMPNCRTVIDVGANRGQFALAVRTYCESASVLSFEPLPRPAAIYRRVFARDPKVSLYEAAIGPITGTVTMHVSAKSDASSLLPITAAQNAFFPGTAEARTEDVRIGRLTDFVGDRIIEAPSMLKLDVQGYELEVLKGCEEVLQQFAFIYVECSFVELYAGQALVNDVIDWLNSRGFAMSGVYNLVHARTGAAVQGDFLFHRTGGAASPNYNRPFGDESQES